MCRERECGVCGEREERGVRVCVMRERELCVCVWRRARVCVRRVCARGCAVACVCVEESACVGCVFEERERCVVCVCCALVCVERERGV